MVLKRLHFTCFSNSHTMGSISTQPTVTSCRSSTSCNAIKAVLGSRVVRTLSPSSMTRYTCVGVSIKVLLRLGPISFDSAIFSLLLILILHDMFDKEHKKSQEMCADIKYRR